MILAGVDEAGRGSVLGPLVVAGVAVEEAKVPELVELGVKDSKLLTPEKRRSLYRKIKKLATQVVYQRVEPPEIDRVVFNGQRLFRLNYLEAQMMASTLRGLNFDHAFVDCCDTNQLRFGQVISDLIAAMEGKSFTVGERNPLFDKITSEHHADRNYPVVSAASIIAKVTRDAAVKRLYKKHGVFGSGYPSDPSTLSFLKRSYDETKGFPPITRLSWLTVRKLQGLCTESEDAQIFIEKNNDEE